MQRPEAALVAGYEAWKKNFGRQVKKGAKAIKIISPIKVKEEVQVQHDGETVTEMQERLTFKVSSVFDVADTEGKELPTIGTSELTGEVQQYERMKQAMEKASTAPITYKTFQDSAKGFYLPKENRIVIKEGLSQTQTLKTLIHEMAHARLHGIEHYYRSGV